MSWKSHCFILKKLGRPSSRPEKTTVIKGSHGHPYILHVYFKSWKMELKDKLISAQRNSEIDT